MITPRTLISWLKSNTDAHGLYTVSGDVTIGEGSIIGIYRTVNAWEHTYLWTPFMDLNDELADKDFDEEAIKILYFDSDEFITTTARQMLQNFYQPR